MVTFTSQGAPSTGEFPQYWGNGIFQSWGNPPVLGKQCFFFPDFDTEDGKIKSYNYFFKCRISNTLWKYFIFRDYQRYFWIIAEKSKKCIHFSPVLGKFMTFGEILLKQNLPQYWGKLLNFGFPRIFIRSRNPRPISFDEGNQGNRRKSENGFPSTMKIRSGIYVKEENSTRFTSLEEHQISLNDGNSIQICINEVDLI